MNMKRLFIGLALVSVLMLPALTFAAPDAVSKGADTSGQSFVPLTNIPGLTDLTTAPALPDFLNSVYRLCIGIAATLAVLQIMRAGIMYMGESVAEKKQAKNLIALSIGGLILVLSPAIVFGIINPSILDLKIDGLDALKTSDAPPILDPGSALAVGDGSCVPQECASGYTCKEKKCILLPKPESCTPIANKAVLKNDNEISCCANQTGCSIGVGTIDPKTLTGTSICYCGSNTPPGTIPAPISVKKFVSFGLTNSGKDFGPVPGDQARYDAFKQACQAVAGTLTEKKGPIPPNSCTPAERTAMSARNLDTERTGCSPVALTCTK